MAELRKEDVLVADLLKVSEFAEQYADNVSIQALDYAMKNDLVDYVMLGNERFIVLTDKSRSYKPNKNKNRETMPVAVRK